ncbi:uncharacterized protein LOC18441875 isoform X2 [Amborella trichopoda]|uniref:uncharacterized protein LOC18441875 isoform X2 n=1 Tax=Amborella trichopoda TaxID=13333 RepID=UPI0009C16546|nr:uncharacterized protein LOC18441875 isoform X2 [Amborella trichopoda]|eukprot:XP_020527570.1 uncharacterized protein LOC18441875 isoform X2 [Amborella trichopoda]
MQKQQSKSSFKESLKALEADIHHANTLGWTVVLSAPWVFFIFSYIRYTWMETLRCLYMKGEPIFESSMLEGGLTELEDSKQRAQCIERFTRKRAEEKRKLSDLDLEREDECGICMETCNKIVLPNCGHSMCINCYHDWNIRSQSCPFCRDSLRRVNSRDLWVLMSNGDVIDTATLSKENVRRFYVYVENLPLIVPENLFFTYDYSV